MADEKISELDAAAALDGTELIELVQGGDNVRTDLDAVIAAAGSLGGLVTSGDITEILVVTQAAYDALDPPESDILYVVSDAPGVKYGYKAAQQDVTSSTTLVDSTGLTFELTPGSWIVDGLLILEGLAAADSLVAWNGGAGWTGGINFMGQVGSATSTSGSWVQALTSKATGSTRGMLDGGTDMAVPFKGHVQVDADGIFAIQFAQAVSNGTPTSMLPGSWVRAEGPF